MDLGMGPIAVLEAIGFLRNGGDFADDHSAGLPPVEPTRGTLGTEIHY